MVLLRTAPLLGTTASLWYTVDQLCVLRVFTFPEHRAKSNEILPSWFKTWFTGSGITSIIVLNTLTLSTATANLLINRSALTELNSARWYGAGLAFTLAHFAFVPAIMWSVKAIVDNSSDGESTHDLDAWLAVHKVRMSTVDLLGWASFLVAVMKTLKTR